MYKRQSGIKIFIDDTPGLSPEVLRAKSRRLKREHDLGLIVIDYLPVSYTHLDVYKRQVLDHEEQGRKG